MADQCKGPGVELIGRGYCWGNFFGAGMFTSGYYTLLMVPVSCFGASGSQVPVLFFGASSRLPGILCWASLSIRGLFCLLQLTGFLPQGCLLLWGEHTGPVLSSAWTDLSGLWCTCQLVSFDASWCATSWCVFLVQSRLLWPLLWLVQLHTQGSALRLHLSTKTMC